MNSIGLMKKKTHISAKHWGTRISVVGKRRVKEGRAGHLLDKWVFPQRRALVFLERSFGVSLPLLPRPLLPIAFFSGRSCCQKMPFLSPQPKDGQTELSESRSIIPRARALGGLLGTSANIIHSTTACLPSFFFFFGPAAEGWLKGNLF